MENQIFSVELLPDGKTVNMKFTGNPHDLARLLAETMENREDCLILIIESIIVWMKYHNIPLTSFEKVVEFMQSRKMPKK